VSERPIEGAEVLRAYLPRFLIEWLAEAPGTTLRAVDGTLVFVDISGFTKMSERLARKGKVGAEEVTDVIGSVFTRLLSVAYGEGGGLIKFGGDALLLLFTGTGHAIRGARAAVGMRQALRGIGAIETTAGKVTLRMSVGVHRGTFHFFLVGESHRELIITGPAATEVVSMEGTASAGEILASGATAELLPPQTLGRPKGNGVLLRGMPTSPLEGSATAEVSLEGVDLLSCVPLAVRGSLLAGMDDPEHRQVTVAFVHFDGVDDLIRDQGPEVVAYGLDELLRVTQMACDKHGVTFLGSDADKDGGKIILVAGAPSSQGDEDERMLLAARSIIDAGTAIPVRIGVNRGPVFAGDIGPHYRRTYTVMGDTVNLAARVMAKAAPREILVTAPVLEASDLRFETEALEPFMVKGKKLPVVAHRLGAIVGSTRTDGLAELTIVGRERELQVLETALDRTLAGRGALIEVIGDAGVGKSRLLGELRTRTGDSAPWHAVACERYESSTPYFPFRPLLRALLGISEDLEHDQAAALFAARVEQACPELMPWLPLLALPLDLEIPDTPEVAALEERFRRERMEGAIGDLLVEFRGGPAVAVIEDAQWMDDASSDLLGAIAARMDELPLAFLVARRDSTSREESGADGEGDHRIQLTLGPLSPEDAVDLIHEATEEHPLTSQAVEALVQRSGGSPRFLKAMLYEVIRSGGAVDQLPGSVEGLVMAQIDRLPPRERRRLRYLSVLGMSFDQEFVGRVLDEDGVDVDLATGPFEGLLDQDGRGGFRFRNGLVRDVAYESLPFRRRRELHARVGEAIEAEAGEDVDDVAELLSLHFFYAQRFGRAWRYSRVAAEQAAEIYANVEARDFFQRALDAAGRLPALDATEYAAASEALGDVRMRLGEYRGAEQAYRRARQRLADDRLGQARLLLKEALVSDFEGRYPQALRTLTRGTHLLGGEEDPSVEGLRAQLAAHYAGIRWAQGRNHDAIQWCRVALSDGEAAGELDATAHALYVLDISQHSLGISAGGPYSKQALALYEQLGNLAQQGVVMTNLGYYAYFQGSWDEAADWYERARDVLLRTGNVVDAAIDDANLGEILLYQGRLIEAEAALRKALRVFRASGVRAYEVFAATMLAATESRSGRFDEAWEMFEEVEELSRAVGDASRSADVAGLRAESMLLQERPDEAVRIIHALLGSLPKTHPFVPWLLRNRGFALMQSGSREEAEETLKKSLAAGRSLGAAHDVALSLVALLRCGASDGRPRDEMEHERDELFERLGIVSIPNVRLPALT
jgi:class 3 adenylate cyclase/tetratricopeptide (TPR) repeat protein